MRVQEWYGWHFPELKALITDNQAYTRTVLTLGNRVNAATTDLSEVLPEEVEAEVKEAAEISMGTEVCVHLFVLILGCCSLFCCCCGGGVGAVLGVMCSCL